MNIHEQVARQELVERAEMVGRGEVFDIEHHVKEQLDLFDRLGKAAILSAKLHGECMRCNSPIPIGGRLICDGTKTTALCESCGKFATQLILDQLAAMKARV